MDRVPLANNSTRCSQLPFFFLLNLLPLSLCFFRTLIFTILPWETLFPLLDLSLVLSLSGYLDCSRHTEGSEDSIHIKGNILSYRFHCCNDTLRPKGKLRRKEFIWLSLLHCTPSLKEVRAETQIRQEPGGRR